jgi:hypothetical protein
MRGLPRRSNFRASLLAPRHERLLGTDTLFSGDRFADLVMFIDERLSESSRLELPQKILKVPSS